MKLIEATQAYLAAEEMGRNVWPYDLALALVKVKRATKADADFYVQEERRLVEQYAELDEKGRMRLTPARTFVFKDPTKGGEYEAARRELGETPAGEYGKPFPLRVKAPAAIKPEHIEALEGFIAFITEGIPGDPCESPPDRAARKG